MNTPMPPPLSGKVQITGPMALRAIGPAVQFTQSNELLSALPEQSAKANGQTCDFESRCGA